MNSRTKSSFFEVSLAVFLLLGVALGAHAEQSVQATSERGESLLSDETMQKIEDLVRRVDLQARILKASSEAEQLGAFGSWARRVETSFRQGYTTLIDDYQFRIRVSPKGLNHGDLTNQDGGENKNYGVSADGQLRIQFAQQHRGNGVKDHLRLLVSNIYTPWSNLPMSAEKAMKRMKVGDFVSVQAKMNILTSANQLKMLAPHFPLVLGAHYMVSGEFQIHVYRLMNDEKTDSTRFRVKVIGVRGRESGAGLRFGYDPADDLKITRVNFVDKILRRRLEFVPFEIGATIPRSNLFLLDYVLNFSDSEARDAYDALIDSLWHPATLKYLNPYNSKQEVEDMLLADASLMGEVFEKNKDRKSEDRGVDRMFRGSNEILGGGGFFIRFGQRDIGRLTFDQTYTENFITSMDRDGVSRHFYMPIYNIDDGFRALGGFFEEEVSRSASVLFETDVQQNFKSFGELSFYLEYKDKKFLSSEIRNLKDFLRKRLPPELYDRINWKDWANNSDKKEARVTSLLVFRPQSLEYVMGMNAAQLYQRFVAYGDRLPEIVANPDRTLPGNEDSYRDISRKFKDRFLHDINYIVYALGVTFDDAQPTRKRADTFIGMRTNPLWQEIGGGFLVHLLETEAKRKKGEKGIEELLSHIYYETTWEAKNADTVHEIFGSCNNRRLYKAVMYIYSILSNRGQEMRLIDDDYIPGLPDKAREMECADLQAR